MLTITVTAIASLKVVLFCKTLITLIREIKVAFFERNVFFWKQHGVKIPINQTLCLDLFWNYN